MSAKRVPTPFRERLSRRLRRWGLRPDALDITAAIVEDRGAAPGPVEVIVPVHGAHQVTTECLASVARHTDLGVHRLSVVVDGDRAFTDAAARRPFADGDQVRVLRHAAPRGFVASVNHAMGLSQLDVVLLNSDTLVTPRWLEKLRDAAYSEPGIATVTPFSNNATICSLPEPLVANELPPGYDAERFAALVEGASGRSYPRLPAGVGMCLFIRRRALEALGLFDVEVFGAGYGEEIDFCLRALAAGWIHVLDDATFIFHHGAKSFGESRRSRVRAAEKVLARRHPAYVPTIADFRRADPLATARRRVLRALAGSGARRARAAGGWPRRVLHVVHGWPPWNHAGTELYAHWLARAQLADREVAVYARIGDPDRRLGDAVERDEDGLRVRLTVNNFTERHPAVRNAFVNPVLEADFARFLGDVDPDLVHVHHLAGHALSLPAVAAAQGKPVLYQIQDWWALCARANYLRPDGTLCSGASLGKCSACLPLTGLPGAAVWNRLGYAARGALARRALRRAAAFVMGSRAVERSYRAAGLLLPSDRVHVVPYGVVIPPPRERRPAAAVPALPLRLGLIASLLPHKGAHVAVEALRGVSAERVTLDVWGDAGADPAYAERLRSASAEAPVRWHPPFPEREKGAVFGRLDLLLVPSLGWESFGLAAREALAYGVPVIASRQSALAEIFPRPGAGGTWIEPGDVAGLRRQIDELTQRPETIAEWRRAAPRVQGVDEHAARIEEIYAELAEGLR